MTLVSTKGLQDQTAGAEGFSLGSCFNLEVTTNPQTPA